MHSKGHMAQRLRVFLLKQSEMATPFKVTAWTCWSKCEQPAGASVSGPRLHLHPAMCWFMGMYMSPAWVTTSARLVQESRGKVWRLL